MNQSKHEVITCSWRKARENAYEWITIGLVLLLIGWKSGASFLSQSRSVVNAKPITFRRSNENRSIKEVHGKPRLCMSFLEYGRHVGQLRRRRAYAPTSNTASHDNMRRSTHGFPFFSHDEYGAPLGGRRNSATNCWRTKLNECLTDWLTDYVFNWE